MRTESVDLVSTASIEPNPENPRLIFHQEELDALQDSIKQQGILVPLTVYRDGQRFRILDGERRWRCAVKLGLTKVPAIVQPKPAPLQNLMMMFAIHHRRNEWDPLPTAMKLKALEDLYETVHSSRPTEKQLAELASLTRGEVRRYKKLLSLPEHYKGMLLEELFKPRSQQFLTVDHVLEATAASTALYRRGVVDEKTREKLRDVIIKKFVAKTLESTVDPRKLVRLSRAVERGEVPLDRAKDVIGRFVEKRGYTIRELYEETVEEPEFHHALELTAVRLTERLEELRRRRYRISDSAKEQLVILHTSLTKLLRR